MGFNIADVLKDVPELDTGREQIEYIALALIDGDAENFYSLSEIESLANNIATIGLQQPLRLRKHPTEESRYLVVSGHRRREALMLLAKDEPEQWSEVACIVQCDTVSPAMQQLRLIFANSDTRKMSSADISEQAVQVEKLFYQLKEEGYEFPGRMRDHVAQVVQVSKTKLARLKVIRENLAKCWQSRYKKNDNFESVAYSLAQLPVNWQQNVYTMIGEKGYITAEMVKTYMKRFSEIEKLKCKKRGRETDCQNMDAKRCHSVEVDTWQSWHCGKCCSSCPDLISCKYACPVMADKVKKLKADKREAQKQTREAQAEKDRPAVEKISALWQRFGLAREMAYKDIEACKNALGIYYFPYDEEKSMKLECGEAKIKPETKLPFGYSCYLSEIERLIALADLFDCSLDWLLCRTDIKEMAQAVQPTSEDVSNSGTGWQTGAPSFPGKYVVLVRYDADCSIVPEKMDWDGTEWTMFGSSLGFEGAKFFGWMPMIPETDENQLPLNDACKTGMSSTGHCGAAAYCPEPADCCLNCDKDCNLRCGWTED